MSSLYLFGGKFIFVCCECCINEDLRRNATRTRRLIIFLAFKDIISIVDESIFYFYLCMVRKTLIARRTILK